MTSIADCIFPISTLLVVPFPSVGSGVNVELHANGPALVVVGLVLRPRLLANPRAVIPDPDPISVLVHSGDPQPVVRTVVLVWQEGNQGGVLVLALDDHHVSVVRLAPLSGLLPSHGGVGIVIRPAQVDPY